jgi:hypothetical protein
MKISERAWQCWRRSSIMEVERPLAFQRPRERGVRGGGGGEGVEWESSI